MRNRFSLKISCVLSILALGLNSSLLGQTSPPSTAPEEWGAVSINMEEIDYPYPVSYFNFSVYGQDVRVAYMDVAQKDNPMDGRLFFIMEDFTTGGTGKIKSKPFLLQVTAS